MKGYAGIMTGTVSAMVCTDALWNMTKMPIEDVVAWSVFIGFGIAWAFIALTGIFEKRKEKPVRQAEFVQLENGLSVMIQRSGRSA